MYTHDQGYDMQFTYEQWYALQRSFIDLWNC